MAMTWIATKLGWCSLPKGVTWRGMALVGLLTGIGFTMSMFIAMLAFTDEALMRAAKLGILLGSGLAAVLGIAWGLISMRR
jgi:NhaA family Na+:H+ antiporter